MDKRHVPVWAIEGSILLPPTPSSLEQGPGNSFGLQTALIPFSQMHEAKDIKTKKKKRHKNRKFAAVKHLANSLAFEKIQSCTSQQKPPLY